MDLNFPQAEAAVLGAILIDPDGVLPPLLEQLRPEDFESASLRHLFEAARDLYLARKPVDPVTIGAAAGASAEYGQVAQHLMQTTPTAANVLEYAEIVRRRAQLRGIRSAALELLDCEDLDAARALISKAAEASADRRREKGLSWRELATAFMEDLDAPPDEYLDLGIPELTKAARVQLGQYVVLGAYNSVGKTALALQIAFALARSGKRVAFFSYETADKLLVRRVFSQQTQTRMSKIQEHRLSGNEVRTAVALVESSWDFTLDFINAAGFTAADVRARTLAGRYDVIFIDYVQLVADAAESPALQVRAISMALHTMAQQLGCLVVALSQVTLPPRDSKGKRPPLRKENLRESQQLANDADVVLLLDLSDPDDYESNRILRMDKNKDVGQARLLLGFDGPRLSFRYLEPPDESRERNAKMDANREKRRARAMAEEAQREDQENAFQEMEGGEEGLPF